MALNRVVPVVASALAFALAGGEAHAALWLDKKPLPAWNHAGMAVPRAPHGDLSDAHCFSQLRKPSGSEDRAVMAAGWRLFEAYRTFNGTSLVTGLSGFDGQCRPTGFQVFVFVDRKFAGTLSPSPMNSRDDGQIVIPLGIFTANELNAQFVRYKPTDPLCCPSGTATVFYKIRRAKAGPVAVATDATK